MLGKDKTKITCNSNLNEKKITDSKTFWEKFKPSFR